MDRTAWIAVALCVIGLVLWEVYLAKQTQRKPTPANAPAQLSPTPTAAANASAFPLAPAVPSIAPKVAEAIPSFPEQVETLRNSDVELRLTNRGGGIREAVLLNHLAQDDQRVVLNSKDRTPIGALVEQPATPRLDEFVLTRESDGSVKCERAADNVTIRKKFFFPKTDQKKDNFIAEMDVDLVNAGAQPYSNPGYFVALGSAAPIHPKDYSYYTRLVWCIDGKPNGIDVNWFGGGGGLFGIGQRAPQPFYQQDLANADWAAVSDQFFTTLIAPLTAKANGVWGRRFDISPEQKMYGLEGALRMPPFQLPPGQTYSAQFEIWAGPKIYHSLARLDHNEAEVMEFGGSIPILSGIVKIVSQFLLNFLNWLHGFLGSYGAVHSCSHHHHQACALAASKQSQPFHAADGRAFAKNAGAAREIQRRPDADEPGGDEALQGVRNQSRRRLSADGDSNPDIFRSLQNARSGGGIAERKISLGARSFPTRHGRAPAVARLGRSTSSRSAWPRRRSGSCR